MQQDTLEKRWRQRQMSASWHPSMAITDAGLTLGNGTVLAGIWRDVAGQPMLAIEGRERAILTLLSAAYGVPVVSRAIHYVKRAADHWRRHDKALAHIELAFAGLPKLRGPDDAYRLFLAETLLAAGQPANVVMEALGFASAGLEKDWATQPRVPAGHGHESGRWTSGEAAVPPATEAVPAAPAVAEGRSISNDRRKDEDFKEGFYEWRRAEGMTTPEEDSRHGRSLSPGVPRISPAEVPKSVTLGLNAKSGRMGQINTDLPGGLEEAQTVRCVSKREANHIRMDHSRRCENIYFRWNAAPYQLEWQSTRREADQHRRQNTGSYSF